MTVTVSVEEASNHLPEILSRLGDSAQEIVIERDGAPIARLLPARQEDSPTPSPRTPGCDAGRFTVPPEFFEPLPDAILDGFYGGPIGP